MKKLVLLLLSALILVAGCSKAPETADTGIHLCSVYQGFNVYAFRQNPIGYITYLKIGSLECAADLQITNPLNPATKMNVFGVVSFFTWRGDPADPIVFGAQVSRDNKDKLSLMGKTGLAEITIEFAFTLYEYDTKTRAYYQSLSSNSAVLKGTLYKEGEQLLFLMSTDSGTEIPYPENFNLQLGIGPTGTPQAIQTADAPGKNVMMNWGKAQ